MLLCDPPGSWNPKHLLPQQRRWAAVFAAVALLVLGGYAVAWYVGGEQPPARGYLGLASGVVAGFLMLYLFSYALRKTKMFKPVFDRCTTNFWLRQHVWLGLLTVPFAFAHGARISSWAWLTTALVVTYAGVIASGVWGIFRQQRLPRRLLEEIPDETIRSQIPALTEQMRQEAELLVLATCGPVKGTGPAVIPQSLKDHTAVVRRAAVRPDHMTGVLAALPDSPIEGSEQLRRYFNDVIDPYLRGAKGKRSPLFLRARMEQDFRALHGQLPAAAGKVIDALRSVCDRRRQFEEQEDLHNKLHAWVSFHLVLSTALVALLLSHAVSAVIYW